MTRTWLILDGDYLCHRAHYATDKLIYRGPQPTGAIFGLLREVKYLQNKFMTNRVIFCWDHGTSLRQQEFAAYKENRQKPKTIEQEESYQELKQQIRLLKTEYLFELGFRNVLFQKGYEADDIIASVCLNLSKKDKAIMVSEDKDLYQLLNHRVSLWKPRQKIHYTDRDLYKDYSGLYPEQWHLVKAVAGCTSDGVPGIQGVGELTAVKFIRGKVPLESRLGKMIQEGEPIWKRNLSLVKLPFPGTKTFDLEEDKVSNKKWQVIARKLGMKVLLETI